MKRWNGCCMKESARGKPNGETREETLKWLSRAYILLFLLAFASIVYVGTKGSKEFLDGWPIFMVFGVMFGLSPVHLHIQGYWVAGGIGTVTRKGSPFLFWLGLVPGIVISPILLGLGVWGIVKCAN